MFIRRPSPATHSRAQSTPLSKGSETQKERAARALRLAAHHACEKLEKRRLLAADAGTFVGGGGTGTNVQERTYFYLDANNQVDKVALWGNITAEFLFVRVNPTDNDTTVVNPVTPTTANITAKDGADLFAIYVSSASPSASISIGTVTNTTTGAMGGFTSSSANSITVNNAQTGAKLVLAPTTASGGVYLGARSFLTTSSTQTGPPTNGIPILSVHLATQKGVRPVSADDTLYAGLVTAPGVSLNRFFLGGLMTGRVDIGGSIDTFYAGDIYTGDASGIIDGSQPDTALQHNFNVAGDLDNLITLGSLGINNVLVSGKPTYMTGFRLSVGGHIGEVKSEASIAGSFYADNLSTLHGLGTIQHEEEGTGPAIIATTGETFFEGNAPTSADKFGVPSLGDNQTTFNDDSFGNAQFLGTPFSSVIGHNAIQLEGSLDNSSTVNDDIDFYAVALQANQTVTAKLSGEGEVDLGIFSPDAGTSGASATSLLASTYAEHEVDQPITFTSTDAGIYYFVVAYNGDTSFTGNADVFGEVDYELDITGVKNLGVGGIVAATDIDLSGGVAFNQTTGAESTQPSVRVDTGDLGAIVSTSGGLLLAGDIASDAQPITATTGNIRVLQAGSIGQEKSEVPEFAPVISAAGNVGVIRTTLTEAAGGIMAMNYLTDPAIGGDYQLIDCAGLFASNLVSNEGIGTIRAEDVGLPGVAPVIHVNADNKGSDGIIDLFDVTGGGTNSFGTLRTGGPQITTGPNGNVRYLHIAPGVTIYNDNFFGGSEDEPITYAAGKSATLIDDSGTPFTINPYRGATVAGDASTAPTTSSTTTDSGDVSTISGDSLSLRTYGIRDKGGVVVVSVEETPGNISVDDTGTTTGTTTGTVTNFTGPTDLSIDTSANGLNGSVEFGSIDMVGNGAAMTFDPTTHTFTTDVGAGAVAQTDNATFAGKSRIDVYDFTATTPNSAGTTSGALGGINNVVNSTTGEIVNFAALDVQTLQGNDLGIATSHTGAPVSGATVYVNAFPFHDQRSLIQIGGTLLGNGVTGDPTSGTIGNAGTIESTGPLGDILTNGTIGSVLANTDKKTTRGRIDGIDAPIYAASPGEFTSVGHSDLSGNLLNVNIGQGLGFSGSGNYALDGIYADNYIGTVTNQGAGSDIRGTIESEGAAGGLPAPETVNTITGEPITSNTVQGLYINNISLTGGGSIIGAIIATFTDIDMTLPTADGITVTSPNGSVNSDSSDNVYGVGSIDLTGNGGIIGSEIGVGGIDGISVKGGFGILNSNIESVNVDTTGSIYTDGYGIRSTSIVGFNSIGSVVANGNGKEVKSTTFAASVRQSESGTTDTFSGQPLDTFDDLDYFLGTTAHSPTRKGATESGVIAAVTLAGTFNLGTLKAWRITGPTTVSFAEGVNKIIVSNDTTGLTVTTGSLNSFTAGNDVVGTTFNVAGEIKSVSAGFFNGSSYINASGPDGFIDYLHTTGGLNATVNASAGIGEILVGTNLASTDITSGSGLDELYVKQSIQSGAKVIVARVLGNLTVRHNILGGSTIQARSITKKTVGGITNGNIILTG